MSQPLLILIHLNARYQKCVGKWNETEIYVFGIVVVPSSWWPICGIQHRRYLLEFLSATKYSLIVLGNYLNNFQENIRDS